MKGYRKLTSKEEVREGDLVEDPPGRLLEAGDIELEELGIAGMFHCVVYRKARTDGCPPGWRWADAGESPADWYHSEEREWHAAGRGVIDEDSTKDYDAFVMPYPEDPRLEEAND